MKSLIKILLLSLVLTTVSKVASAQINKVVFDEKKLTSQQQTDLKTFRDLKGKDRWEAFQKIRTLIPDAEIVDGQENKMERDPNSIEVVMTKQQFIKLFGAPAEDRKSVLVYDLDQVHEVCSLHVYLKDEKQVGGYSLPNCDKYVPMLK